MKKRGLIILFFLVFIASLSHCQHITEVGLRLIKHEEGEVLHTYRCMAGIATIGVGHTGADVQWGMVITRQQSDLFLRRDVERFERYINRQATRILLWHERDALISFTFNLGYRLDGDLKRYVNEGRDILVKSEMKKFCRYKSNGIYKTSPRLLERRIREGKLYEDGTQDF